MITAFISIFTLLMLGGFVRQRYGATPAAAGVRHGEEVPYVAEFELYANGFSHCSRKVMLVLAEHDVEFIYRHVELIETGAYGTLEKEYLRINPNGLIPALVHLGVPVVDSDEIVQYVADRYESRAKTALGRENKMRHRFWVDRCRLDSIDPMGSVNNHLGACIPGLTLPLFAVLMQSVNFSALVRGLALHYDRKRVLFFLMARLLGPERVVTAKPISTLILKSKKAAGEHFRELEKHLSESVGPYLTGSEFGMGDAALAVVYLRLEEAGWLDLLCPRSEFPLIQSHYDALRTRRSWEVLLDTYPRKVAEASQKLRELVTENNNGLADLYYI